MINKLVLPQSRKDLIRILITGADARMEDIVKGKTGGIITIATGPAGTGKTLTAEVFSEEVRCPLYRVQCSQLGTSETKLEEELTTVLKRASRWKAILLIDEADVYIHARGNDIQQNAIVGIFLRILEYYPGILFMTSNRGTIIDDAIMSRATAWIQYELPDKDETAAIWRVLSDQYKAGLTDEMIKELVDCPTFEEISGRSIKNLLRLASLMCLQANRAITVKDIVYLSQFLDLKPDQRPEPGS